ncbi:MAG TPA: hypothetical protein VFL16_11785 [Steroidobacteraceae bacterium]|nr:hypothetical protein [Steroidobacteraceae bacterium]HEX5161891.1 hypothetical protein [Steroidobacteraceae bacterium]
MKTLLRFAIAVALTTVAARAFLRRMEDRRSEQSGERPSDDAVPTLHAVQDAEPQKPEPLREGDLNVAQNAPF